MSIKSENSVTGNKSHKLFSVRRVCNDGTHLYISSAFKSRGSKEQWEPEIR